MGAQQMETSNQSDAISDCCIRCRKAIGHTDATAFATVHHRSLFAPTCQHGPFCSRCQRNVAAQILPSCTCKSIIDSWDQTPVQTDLSNCQPSLSISSKRSVDEDERLCLSEVKRACIRQDIGSACNAHESALGPLITPTLQGVEYVS